MATGEVIQTPENPSESQRRVINLISGHEISTENFTEDVVAASEIELFPGRRLTVEIIEASKIEGFDYNTEGIKELMFSLTVCNDEGDPLESIDVDLTNNETTVMFGIKTLYLDENGRAPDYAIYSFFDRYEFDKLFQG